MVNGVSKIKLVSLFSGAGGLDKGFELASNDDFSYQTVWANEYDRAIHATYEKAFPSTRLVKKSITQVEEQDLTLTNGNALTDLVDSTTALGLVGGPPCQSWSAAGAKRGKDDKRGQLFWDYIRILKTIRPVFFVAENVPGILAPRNAEALGEILRDFQAAGYDVKYAKLNASFHNVPEDRERVIFVGFRSDLTLVDSFSFPRPAKVDLRGEPVKCVLADNLALKELAGSARVFDRSNRDTHQNEYLDASFSPLFLSRNRCRTWQEPSFTIQATARHIPIHPDHGQMTKVAEDSFKFNDGVPHRRLTVRECAEIQTFPSDFEFVYSNITDGYKMVGNAVPVNLATAIAREIAETLKGRDLSVLPKSLSVGVNAIRVDPYL